MHEDMSQLLSTLKEYHQHWESNLKDNQIFMHSSYLGCIQIWNLFRKVPISAHYYSGNHFNLLLTLNKCKNLIDLNWIYTDIQMKPGAKGAFLTKGSYFVKLAWLQLLCWASDFNNR